MASDGSFEIVLLIKDNVVLLKVEIDGEKFEIIVVPGPVTIVTELISSFS